MCCRTFAALNAGQAIIQVTTVRSPSRSASPADAHAHAGHRVPRAVHPRVSPSSPRHARLPPNTQTWHRLTSIMMNRFLLGLRAAAVRPEPAIEDMSTIVFGDRCTTVTLSFVGNMGEELAFEYVRLWERGFFARDAY